MDYYIRIGDVAVPVSEEIYKVYCQGDRKERYFREGDRRNNTFFYDALDTEELNGSEMFSDPMQIPWRNRQRGTVFWKI